MDSSLQKLLATFQSLEFEEYGSVRLTAVSRLYNDFCLDMTVYPHERPEEVWRVRCHAVRDMRIMNEWGLDGLNVVTSHPVLLPHIEPIAELYFSQPPRNVDELMGQLAQAHHAAVDEWFDFLHFFNRGPGGDLRDLLEGGHGKLADGPESTIARYAEVLRRAGVPCSSPPAREPGWWDGQAFVRRTKPLFAIILGRSYLVADSVSAELLERGPTPGLGDLAEA